VGSSIKRSDYGPTQQTRVLVHHAEHACGGSADRFHGSGFHERNCGLVGQGRSHENTGTIGRKTDLRCHSTEPSETISVSRRNLATLVTFNVPASVRRPD